MNEDANAPETPSIFEEQKPFDGGLLSGVMDLIAEEYSPKTDTFPVTIKLGSELVEFQFKRLNDGKDMEDLQKRAAKWAQNLMPKKVLKGGQKIAPMSPEMKKWFLPDVEVLAQVYIITQLATHDDFKTEHMVMRLYRQAWPIFKSICAQIDLGATNQIGAKERADYEAEKKG